MLSELKLVNGFKKLAAALLLLLLLVACADAPADDQLRDGATTGSPQVQLDVLIDGSWTTVTEGMVLSPQPEFRARVNDRTRITSVELQIDGGAWTALTLSGDSTVFTLTRALSGGNHQVAVRATNSAGNVTTGTATFSVDATPPVIQLLEIDGIDYAGTTIPDIEFLLGPSSTLGLLVEGTDSGSAAGVSIVLESLTTGETFRSVAPGLLSTVIREEHLTEGVNAFRVFAVDAAGNSSNPYAFSVLASNPDEHVAPVVSILAPDAGAAYSIGSTITVVVDVERGSQPVGSVQVQLDGVNLTQSAENDFTFVGNVPEVAGTFLLTAHALSSGAIPLRSNVVVQSVEVRDDAPLVEILGPAEDWIYGPTETITVNLLVTDQGGGIGDVHVTLDGDPMASIDGRNFSIPAPTDTDEYEIRAWAYNAAAADAVHSVVASRFVWVDATPPVVHIAYPGHGSILPYAQIDEAIEVEIQAEDFGSELHEVIVQYNNGGGWTDFATLVEDDVGTVDWNPQAGPNILRALARDRFGNTAESDVVAVFVTNTPNFRGPELSLLSPASGRVTTTSGGTVQFEIGVNQTSTISVEEFWLNIRQISPVPHPDSTGTHLIYTWDVPADLEPGTYVLFYRADGDSPTPDPGNPTENQSGTTLIAIIVTVE